MEKQDLSKINIQEMYPEECKTYDIVVHCEVWHIYHEGIPKPGDIVLLNADSSAFMRQEIQYTSLKLQFIRLLVNWLRNFESRFEPSRK